MSNQPPSNASWLRRMFDLREEETGLVLSGFAMFFLLFAGYWGQRLPWRGRSMALDWRVRISGST